MVALVPSVAGIPDAVLSSQAAFRGVMDAMARPGSIRVLNGVAAPNPLMPASAAIALALFDQETPIWLDAPMTAKRDVASWLTFHTSAPFANPAACAFALVADASVLPALDAFNLGTNEYPDRASTLIIQVESLTLGPSVTLRGPGIDGTCVLRATLGSPTLLEGLGATRTSFPRGLDLILVAGDAIVALPRTTCFSAQET